MRKIRLRNPYVVKVRQEPLLHLYGLRFQGVSTLTDLYFKQNIFHSDGKNEVYKKSNKPIVTSLLI